MGLILQKALGEGAPEIEDAIYDAIFDGVTEESHPDWAGPNKFGGQDDGERWRFAFTLTENGAVMYDNEKPIVVDVLTNQTMGKKSNAYAIMAGILTKAERDRVDAGEPIDSDALIGRPVQVVVEHNSGGWPKVAQVIAARKGAVAPAKAAKGKTDVVEEEDEEAALLAQIEAKKAAKAAKPSAEETAAAEKKARAEALRAQLAELEEE